MKSMDNSKSVARLAILATLLLVICTNQVKGAVKPDKGKVIKILTIGNSFSKNAGEYLEEIVSSVDGYSIELTEAIIGGCSLEKHANLIKACEGDPALKPYKGGYSLLDFLKMDQYDYVTIQQVSLLSFEHDSFEPFARQLVEYIHEHVPNAQVIIHQTWAYSPESERLPRFDITRDEMHEKLEKNYDDLAKTYNTFILPSGNAFYAAYDQNKEINLWRKDNYHANAHGCYLAGCAWFGVLYNVSPKKIGFVPKEINSKEAKFLRKIADKESKIVRRYRKEILD